MRPIDADDLINKIFEDNDGYILTDRLNCYDVELYIDAQPTLNNWVSVKDKLPDDATRVLVFVWSVKREVINVNNEPEVEVTEDYDVYIARYYKGKFEIEKNLWEVDGVLAWQSLPVPPEDKND